VVAFFEGADGDVAVLPKPLILNPAGTEGQVLINALASTNGLVPRVVRTESYPERELWEPEDGFWEMTLL
jgi:hypothetical protein